MSKVYQSGVATGAIQDSNNQNAIDTTNVDQADLIQEFIIKRAADGTALGSKASAGGTISLTSVVRNGAGDYTVTIVNPNFTAAHLAADLTCNTAGLVGSAVVTDATHIAVATKTDAGVATDSIFTLRLAGLV